MEENHITYALLIEHGSQQPGQNERVPDIGLHPRTRDLFYLNGVGNYYSFHPWLQQVIHMPGIGRGLDDHMIARSQILL